MGAARIWWSWKGALEERRDPWLRGLAISLDVTRRDRGAHAQRSREKNLSKTEDLQRGLEGRVAIVTGAASGIGLATALLLEARGAAVVAKDINPAVNELARGDGRIVPFVGDVAQEATATRVVALAVERFGKLELPAGGPEGRGRERSPHEVSDEVGRYG
ncbi:SDR family NAD(P)-dependent oxidoreductase [Sorangium sp. So ce321]